MITGRDIVKSQILVAQGHHSYQASISGELIISDESELKKYKERRRLGEGKSYFVLQAQNFYLPGLAVGQILKGHIIESELGNYQPMNKIVLDANFLVNTVHMGVPNPFFK